MFMMLSKRLQMSLALLLITIFVGSTAWQTLPGDEGKVSYRNVSVFATANTSFSAPYFHSVSAGDVWVYPSSPTDLGARDMSCECFDPDQTCCMAKDKSIAPFCVSKNSTCCANTYCGPNETCCGDACCPSGTTCDAKSRTSGCCPYKQTCSGTPICYDYNTTSCTGTFFALAQCCPLDLPYCRNFSLYGIGCFASSTELAIARSTTSIPTVITNSVLAESTSGLSNLDTTIAATTTASSISTILTVTITVQPLSSGQYSIELPSINTSNGTATIYASIAYALTFPSINTTAQPTTTLLSTKPSTSQPTLSFTPTSSSSSSPTTTSTLCYNTSLLAPAACPTLSTTTDANAGYSPPGTSIIRSSGIRLASPFQRLKALFSHLTPLQCFLTGITTTTISTYLWHDCSKREVDLKPLFTHNLETQLRIQDVARRVRYLEEQTGVSLAGKTKTWWFTLKQHQSLLQSLFLSLLVAALVAGRMEQRRRKRCEGLRTADGSAGGLTDGNGEYSEKGDGMVGH